MGKMENSSVLESEIEKFDAMAEEWWDPNGKFRPLHHLNPCRLDYINTQIAVEFNRDLTNKKPFEGLQILDIGCGGGLLCEPQTRLGAEIKGIDASERNINVAKAHARQMNLDIDYQAVTAEAMNREKAQFDVVFCMEVIEHVAYPADFMITCANLLKPGGLIIMSTLNRTPKSFALAIIGAEYVLRWLPRRTHDWQKFIKPVELEKMAHDAGLKHLDNCGMVLDPLRWEWTLRPRDLSINYVVACQKPKAGHK